MTKINIRRQWNSWRVAEADLDDLSGLHWTSVSGGVCSRAPQPFVHGYVSCANVVGDVAHSCRHGRGPHSIKICIVKKDQPPEVWREILEIVGPKPTPDRTVSSDA